MYLKHMMRLLHPFIPLLPRNVRESSANYRAIKTTATNIMVGPFPLNLIESKHDQLQSMI